MSLTLYAFDDFVSAAENALSTGSVKFTNFKTGSAGLALCEAIAGNAQSLQLLIQNVFNSTRLGTSQAGDVDSFVGDYGMTRLAAVAASGQMLFNRNNTTTPTTIPVGTVVQSVYSLIQYQVVADTNNSNYNPIANGYVMGDGVASLSVSVQAVFPGLSGNILAGTQMQLVSGTLGISGVTVPADFKNGAPQETDAQLKTRFLNFISSLSRGTLNAVTAAIQGVQPNLTFQIIEGKDFDGATFPAGFIVVVDDGTGAISGALQNTILTAINAVRAAGTQCKVYPPTVQVINWTVHLTYGSGYNATVVNASVVAAVNAVINGYGVGNGVHLADIEIAIQNTPGVAAYSGVTINGGTVDILMTQTELAQAGTGTFS